MPKKDAISCEKPWGAASRHRSTGLRMGEPGWGNAQSPVNESIVHEEGTRGSETSKYPEEKKENSISLVVASEEERGQTGCLRTIGVEERRDMTIGELNCVEMQAGEGDRPVSEAENS